MNLVITSVRNRCIVDRPRKTGAIFSRLFVIHTYIGHTDAIVSQSMSRAPELTLRDMIVMYICTSRSIVVRIYTHIDSENVLNIR